MSNNFVISWVKKIDNSKGHGQLSMDFDTALSICTQENKNTPECIHKPIKKQYCCDHIKSNNDCILSKKYCALMVNEECVEKLIGVVSSTM